VLRLALEPAQTTTGTGSADVSAVPEAA
jgi:hypothetical protein